jgi:hypothetical protein
MKRRILFASVAIFTTILLPLAAYLEGLLHGPSL